MEKSKVSTSSKEETSKKLHHKAIHHVQKHRVKLLVVLFGAIIVLLIYSLVNNASVNSAKQGDTVKVDYVGTLDDGTLFDTSLAEVAKANNVFNAQRPYDPLAFTIGNKQVLEDFEKAAIGMKPGETKKIKILAENAYKKNNDLVQKLPIVLTVKKDFSISVEEFKSFLKEEPILGKEYSVPGFPFKLTIESLVDKTVNLTSIAHMGDIVSLPMRNWNSTVTDISLTNITLKQEPRVGDKALINDMVGNVIAVTPTEYTIDLNLPIAGKDLNFEITLVEIVKA